MAFQDEARRARLIEDSASVSRSIETAEELRRQLDAIAADGFLIAESHDVIGVTDIGVPVLGRHGRAVASIVVSTAGPSFWATLRAVVAWTPRARTLTTRTTPMSAATAE